MPNKEKQTEEYYAGSVLLSDHIKTFVKNGKLIVRDPFYDDIDDTFDEQQLERAKYNVRLGKTYYKAGKYGHLDDNNRFLYIEPYELVFVESYEVFKLPCNVIGKYDLRIRGCLGGIGLQTGLQLDPMYHGRFFCPLFNFSDETIIAEYRNQLASIDFIYTTPPTKETKPFESKSGRQECFSLSEALPATVPQSGLGRLRSDIRKAEQKMENVNMVFFMVIGIIVAAIAAILIPRAITEVTPLPVNWPVVGMIVGAFVLIAVGFVLAIAWASTRRAKASNEKASKRKGQ